MDLVVHHGGSGTVLGALSKGLPQLILPQGGSSQFINADMIVSAGLGLSLKPNSVNADSITEAARSLLTDSSYRNAAQPICREIATMPHSIDVLPTLVRLSKTADPARALPRTMESRPATSPPPKRPHNAAATE